LNTLEYLLARANELGIKVDYPGGTAGTLKAIVNCDSLNVRAGPSTATTIVDHLKRGDVVTVLDSIGNWAKIGEFRWVYSYYLDQAGQS
jgi:uncharacterized protein YgiM (DUF1202 family)